jgi:hypothetical protein
LGLAKGFPDDNIQHPMQIVFDASIGWCRRKHLVGFGWERRDVKAPFRGCFSALFVSSRRGDSGDAVQALAARMPL